MTTTGRPLRKDAERNRRRILDAARELFAQEGVSVTLNDIAHHAGVGVGTVYRRFPDKDELVAGLFEQRIDELAELLDAALADPDPWRGLTTYLERSLELGAEDRGLQQLMLGAAGSFERVARARERLQPPVAQLIDRARDAGQLRPDVEPQDVAIVYLMLGPVIDLTYEVEPELWRRYLAIVLQGLRAHPEPPEPFPVQALPVEQLDAVMVEAYSPQKRGGAGGAGTTTRRRAR
jgi:AcrR family transcriptional regulator